MSNDTQKKYTRTQRVNDQRLLNVAVIAQNQRNELTVRMLDLKRKVRDEDNIYVRCMTHTK